MKIEDKLVPVNFTKGRGTEKPIALVLHTMVGTLEGTYSWFKNPQSGVSAHYGIGLDGRVWRFVKDEDTAYHAGTKYGTTSELVKEKGALNPNAYTIGIEHEDNGQPDQERTEAQYEASSVLVHQLCKTWDIPIDAKHIIRHHEIRANKTCPSALDTNKIIAKAKASAMNGTQPTLDWAIKLESFFIERGIPPERRESEVRQWADTDKILDGFITKWKQELNLTQDSGLPQIEEHFSKLLELEDRHAELLNAIEKVVGHFEDFPALLTAISALERQRKADKDELDTLRNKVEEWNKKKGEDFIRSLEVLNLIIKIYRKVG